MIKVAELIELADLFDSRGFFKAADLCDQIIATAAEIDIKQYPEVATIRALAQANFEDVKSKIRTGLSVVVLTRDTISVKDIDISYIKGNAINNVNGFRLDPRTTAMIFEKEKSKIGPDDAVLFIESGGVKHLFPPKNIHVLKEFFNQKVTVKENTDAVSKIVNKYRDEWEEDTMPEAEYSRSMAPKEMLEDDSQVEEELSKGVGGVKLF